MTVRWGFALPILGLALFGFVTYYSVTEAKGHSDRYFYWSSIRLDSRPLQNSEPCNPYIAECANWGFFTEVRPNLLERSSMLSGLPAFLGSLLITGGLRRLGVNEVTAFFVSMPVLLSAWYYFFGRLLDYWSARKLLSRHLPLAIGACSLIVAIYVGDEAVRAIVAVGSILLMIYQYLIYRKANRGSRLVFLTLFPLEVGLLSVWLVLNVARFYTYEPEAASIWAWHEQIIDLQNYLDWAIAVLGAIALTWTLLRFTRWLRGRIFAEACFCGLIPALQNCVKSRLHSQPCPETAWQHAGHWVLLKLKLLRGRQPASESQIEWVVARLCFVRVVTPMGSLHLHVSSAAENAMPLNALSLISVVVRN